MQANDRTGAAEVFLPVMEGADAPSRVVLICEHASNHIPARWGDLGLTEAQRQAHIAWDPGALGLARGLARRLGATLVHAPVSRLVYDLNRAPDMAGAMPLRSEIHDIPGNADLSADERARRTAALYVPFHAGLRALLMDRMARGITPVIITIHSFTPVWHGQPRAVEFGVIHDADPTLPRLIVAEADTDGTLVTRMNEPYSAQDDVTHTLRLHATPYDIPNAMLELRNDLIADATAQEAMADRLAPMLARAVASLPPSGR